MWYAIISEDLPGTLEQRLAPAAHQVHGALHVAQKRRPVVGGAVPCLDPERGGAGADAGADWRINALSAIPVPRFGGAHAR